MEEYERIRIEFARIWKNMEEYGRIRKNEYQRNKKYKIILKNMEE